jgi:hypothetical protein
MKKIMIDVSDELYQVLKNTVKITKRSINKEIIYRLENLVEPGMEHLDDLRVLKLSQEEFNEIIEVIKKDE